MIVYADRVKETTTSTGTGTINLAGAVSGYRTFVAGVGSGALVYYCIADSTIWEVGEGTVTDSSPDTLSRTRVLASSNANALVNLPSGTKDVFLTFPAEAAFRTLDTPDALPASPDTMDDEFTATSLDAKWTWRNQGSATATLTNGALILKAPQNNSESVRIIEQTAPTAPWKFRAKVAGAFRYANYSRVYFGVLENSAGKFTAHYIGYINGAMYGIERYNSTTSWNSRPYEYPTGFPVRPLYFEIENDSTNLIFRVSATGHRYDEVMSETIASFVGTANRIILGANDLTNTADGAAGIFEWFRRIS